MDGEISLEVGKSTIESLFPLKLRFEGPDGHPLILTRRKKSILLSDPNKEIKVSIPHTSASAARRAMDTMCNGDPVFEKYLRLLSKLPEATHSKMLNATHDIIEDSCQVLDFLGKLYQEEYKWHGGFLWLVDDSHQLLFVNPMGPRKAHVKSVLLWRHSGRNTVRELSLEGIKPENIKGAWSLVGVPYSAFETAAEGLEERGYDEISEAVKYASAYKSRKRRDESFDELKKGLSQEELQELKEKAEGVRKREKRKSRYDELYREFKERKYEFLPDKNELLLYPKCVVSFGVDVRIQKIISKKLKYHIGSRIHTGKWPPSVEFAPKDKFYDHKIRKLRKSIRKAVNNIPDGPANRLKAYALNWVLSENS